VRAKVFVDGHLNAEIVGQSVQKLAALFGLKNVPAGARVIIGEVTKMGKEEVLSEEKLSPILAMYRASDFTDALGKAEYLLMFGGPGHTAALYTNYMNKEAQQAFGQTLKAVRLLVNTPASQGAIGDVYNFHLDPSLTLGCGSWGSTSVSSNVAPKHLLNVKSVIERRENMLWFRVPPKVYFKGGCLEVALGDLKGCTRAFVVTDKPLYDLGVANKVTDVLDELAIGHQVFYHVTPDPTLECIRAGLKEIVDYRPDVIIAIGGGSPMDAAKIMWLMVGLLLGVIRMGSICEGG
jgi:acetaldehyde dehydrogenase/alcohol dehydrogenase